jgi:T3SS negative regulator,GrlR
MVEGFWLLQFEALQGNGAGVVVFVKGKVFGGDNQTTYVGDYHEEGGTLSARVFIHNYVPGVASIIGVEGDYLLDVKGTVEGDVISAVGTAVEHPVAGMALKLIKLEDIPQ